MSALTVARLAATTARWADRHHPTRATLRAYHRRADALYWDPSPVSAAGQNRQFARLDDVREPLARAARALAHEHGLDFVVLAEELGELWQRPDVARWIGGHRVYRIDYAAWLITEWVEELQEAAAADPAVAGVLAEHLHRP
ncbi:hypothetical protein KGD82_16460 [Nocardiopsis eucommiae]|uniref:Uncharacterized protein n=1 Tax=Nocardiopsis eucommiae TaxID=2831970 RepID=A0A975QJJ4_9ACTN|nr:hypothetical protein KGD82_16460 [Nocardiopsis eucommiae]